MVYDILIIHLLFSINYFNTIKAQKIYIIKNKKVRFFTFL